MKTIDADAHVIETEHTWSYLTEDERHFKPVVVKTEPEKAHAGTTTPAREYWAIDGRLWAREQNIGHETEKEAREMSDIDRRLAHMVDLDIDVQVLFPTIFLRPLTRDPACDLALARAYNRWLINIWQKSKDCLHWVVVPPLQSLGSDPALVRAELVAGKENGACGIFMNGFAFDRELWNPYFFPLYEMAQELDLAVCMHAGNDCRSNHDFFEKSDALAKFRFPVISSLHSLLQFEIPRRFPAVRWGFVEAGAGWLPFVLSELELRCKRRGKRFYNEPLKEANMFVSCQVNENIPVILSQVGEDNIMTGTDYGHSDNSAQIMALRMLQDTPDMPVGAVDKILGDNPARLYGLN